MHREDRRRVMTDLPYEAQFTSKTVSALKFKSVLLASQENIWQFEITENI